MDASTREGSDNGAADGASSAVVGGMRSAEEAAVAVRAAVDAAAEVAALVGAALVAAAASVGAAVEVGAATVGQWRALSGHERNITHAWSSSSSWIRFAMPRPTSAPTLEPRLLRQTARLDSKSPSLRKHQVRASRLP